MDTISILKEVVSVLEKAKSPLNQQAIAEKIPNSRKSIVSCFRWIIDILSLYDVVRVTKVGPVKIITLTDNYKENFNRLVKDFEQKVSTKHPRE